MTFAVGILYSIHEFLDFAQANPIRAEEFAHSPKFVLSSAATILQTSQNCNWVQLTVDGYISLTDRGKKILAATSTEIKLRLQIEDLVTFHRPAWATAIMHGREEAMSGMPPDAEQCFKESGLCEPWDDDLLEWWANAGLYARVFRDGEKSKTGIQAERLTIEYETKRIGKKPKWLSPDSAFAGYDVLSAVSPQEDAPLPIEVKGSVRPPKASDFSFSQLAFRTASKSASYILHLWFVADQPQLFIVPFPELAKHLPTNNLSGKWENTRVPFKSFLDRRVI